MRIDVISIFPAYLDPLRLSLIGRFEATSMTARLSINAEGPATRPPGPRQTIRIVGSLTGRRLGDCPSNAPAPAPSN